MAVRKRPLPDHIREIRLGPDRMDLFLSLTRSEKVRFDFSQSIDDYLELVVIGIQVCVDGAADTWVITLRSLEKQKGGEYVYWKGFYKAKAQEGRIGIVGGP